MRFGIDLGGTKVEIIALADSGEVALRERTPTPAGDYQATVHAIANLVVRSEERLGTQGTVGVGIPGSLSLATGLVRNANSTALNGHPLKQDLEAALQREVRIANDANCFALSEAADGAGAGAASVFGVIFGTGCGGGVVVNGQIVAGINGIAGEWGHNPLPSPTDEERPGPGCYCGRPNCIESWLSGPNFARSYVRAGGDALKPQEIIDRMHEGETLAKTCFGAYVDRAARSLASIMNVLDPEVIVLGGGMSNVDELYDQIPKVWAPHVFSDRIDTRLVKNKHGDSSGVRGAAWLWPLQT
ncbi:MAG: ROK family protein [Burkholderiaceae bacterium]